MLTSKWINRPKRLEKLVSSPATFGRTPVASITGLETKPPGRLALPTPGNARNGTPALPFPIKRIRLDEQADLQAV